MKTENYAESTEYRLIADEVISEKDDLHWLLSMGVRLAFIESAKKKMSEGKEVYAECIKVEELWQVFCPCDFIIVIYGQHVQGMSKEQKKILLYHELLHCSYDETKNGVKYRTAPHDIEDFRVIIDNYGLDWARVM